MIILIIAPVSDLRSGLQTLNTVVARITQLVECWFNKPVVEGSIPSLGIVQKLFVFIVRVETSRGRVPRANRKIVVVQSLITRNDIFGLEACISTGCLLQLVE